MKCVLTKLMVALALALPVSAATVGCAALSAVSQGLPSIAGVVADAEAVIAIVDSAAQQFFRQHSVPVDVQQEYVDLHAKALRALNAANAALRGAKAVDQKKFDAAFNEFTQAYNDLRNMLTRNGIMNDNKLSLGSDVVVAPEPAALTFKVK